MNPLALLPSLTPPSHVMGVGRAAAQRMYTGQILTPFDHGLSAVDLAAIRMALRGEMNPNHLVGFASTLAADHPVSASLLYARASLLEQRPRGARDEIARDGAHAADRLVDLIDRATSRRWSGANAVQWISEIPMDVGRNLAELVRIEASGSWSDVCEGLGRVSPSPSRWPRLDRLSTAAEGAQAFGRAGQTPLHYECALALAQPVPPTARPQFPTACALQAFGFHELYPRTRGPDIFARATDFAHAVVLSDRLGTTPWIALLLQRRRELDALVYSSVLTFEQAEREVRRAANDLVVDPRADLGDVPAEVMLLARSLVIEIGPDLRVVDPMAARIALKPVPLEPRSANRQRWTTTYHKNAELSACDVQQGRGVSCST